FLSTDRHPGLEFQEDLRLDYHSDNVVGTAGVLVAGDNLLAFPHSSFFLDLPPCDGIFFGCTQVSRFKQQRRSVGVYADATIEITDALKLIAGLRFSDDRLEIHD